MSQPPNDWDNRHVPSCPRLNMSLKFNELYQIALSQWIHNVLMEDSIYLVLNPDWLYII
jgi:hypothetical protein